MASSTAFVPGAEGAFPAGAAFRPEASWDEPDSTLSREQLVDFAPDDHKLETFVHAAEKHRNQLMWLALRITHSYEDAEDVVQRALLKAFKNLDKFRGDSQMTTWLGVIVQNTAREQLRTRKGKVFVPLEHAPDSEGETSAFDLPDPCKNPEEHYMSTQREQMVLDAIGRMRGENRRALQFCVLDEMPYLAAARILNVTLSTVKSRVFRGKQILKLEMMRKTRHV